MIQYAVSKCPKFIKAIAEAVEGHIRKESRKSIDFTVLSNFHLPVYYFLTSYSK